MKSSSTKPIFSIGYEQRSIEEVVDILTHNQIALLVDVRLNAISRKRGFSKTALKAALEAAGIEYSHQRELGNPRENRDSFRSGQACARDRYLEHMNNGASETYRKVIQRAAQNRTALLCYEREHDDCHRSCILETALDDDPEFSVAKL